MSVVVLGMEIPKRCESCGIPCELWASHKVGQRHPYCPLRPLPEKHGRLIDAKDLEKMRFTDGINGEDCKLYVPFVDVAEAIFKCPTIVEAEGD